MEEDHVNTEAATQSESEPKPYVPYTIEFNEESGILSGIIPLRPTSENNPENINLKSIDLEITRVSSFKIQQELEARKQHLYYFPTNSVEAFVRKVKKGQHGTFELAQRKDAELKITVSNDKLSARAQSSHAWGGTVLSQEQIDTAIEKAKLDKSLLISEALEKLLHSSESLDLVIAEAIPAENGENASLEILLKSKVEVVRDIESLEAIDQHEVFDYTIVEINEKLAIKTPATDGKDGLNVLGKPVKAKKGKDVKLPKLAGGAEISVDDKNVIIASIKGHPVLSTSQIKVDPVLTIKEVGLDCGHIDYDGTVIVTGNVRSGYDVKATGDIFVKGFVNKSKLEAGGGIFIQSGIQGDSHNDEHTSILIAKNDIEVKFVNQSKINSGGELRVKEYLINCTTLALGRITIGTNSKRGAIIGGSAKSYSGIHVKSLGSDAYIKTHVFLGANTLAQQELEKYKQKKLQRLSELKKLSDILAKLRSTDSPSSVGRLTLDKERKIEATVEAITKIITDYDEHIEKLEKQVPDVTPLQLKVDGAIFPNVEISINEASHQCSKEYKNVLVEREGEAIEFKPNT